MEERLHKVLAHCGVGSRRQCEEIIAQGRVEVDGRVVTKLGTKVDPGAVELKVDGERVGIERRVYYLLNKPRGFICTNRDNVGRPCAIDLIPDDRRIYTVGRLDEASEGLVLLTNDGPLANLICHPRYQVDKTYELTVRGKVTARQLEAIERGVWLAEGRTAPAQIKRVDAKGSRTRVTVTIWEGRNRELRRIFAKVDLRVVGLVRTAIGPLKIETLEPGAYRRVTPKELAFALERADPNWRPAPPPRAANPGWRRAFDGDEQRRRRPAKRAPRKASRPRR